MIENITNYVASGFWQAIVFIIGCNIAGGILRMFFKRRSPVFANLLLYGSNTAAYYFVWTVRESSGWLVFCVLGAISTVIILIFTALFKSS